MTLSKKTSADKKNADIQQVQLKLPLGLPMKIELRTFLG